MLSLSEAACKSICENDRMIVLYAAQSDQLVCSLQTILFQLNYSIFDYLILQEHVHLCALQIDSWFLKARSWQKATPLTQWGLDNFSRKVNSRETFELDTSVGPTAEMRLKVCSVGIKYLYLRMNFWTIVYKIFMYACMQVFVRMHLCIDQ